MLQSKRKLVVILVSIVLYALLLKVLTVWKAYVENQCHMERFLGRCDAQEIHVDHIVDMDFEKMESREGQQKKEEASWCIYRGNDYGMEAFMGHFPQLIFQFIGFVIYSVIVCQISVGVFGYVLITTAVLIYVGVKKEKYCQEENKKFNTLWQKSVRVKRETLDQGCRHDIMLYHAKEWMMSNLKQVEESFFIIFGNLFRVARNSTLIYHILGFLRDAIVYVILIRQISEGKIGVEELLVYAGAIAGYAAWMNGMVQAALGIVIQNKTITAFRDFLEFGKLEKKEKNALFEQVKGHAHEIRLENVSYVYDGNEEASIKDISLTIRQGEKIALVGANGAGKTTLVKLISGLYTPTEGTIYMDGIDIATLDKEEYFQEFSVVFQDNIIFACSVAENVACCVDYDEERVIESLKKADLYEKVLTMKDGIHTMLTRRLDTTGEELSGGETQRLMLARALYRDASTLILDEPTAALDPLAESKMYEAYTKFGKEKTSIFISHRLSSTGFCDRVCFIQEGRITEVGTHQQLLDKNGAYAEMFYTQAKYYQEGKETAYEGELEVLARNA